MENLFKRINFQNKYPNPSCKKQNALIISLIETKIRQTGQQLPDVIPLQ